jgi:hypothetical protein
MEYKKLLNTVVEVLIHSWDVSDEYGWRSIELWRVGDDLVLVAYDKDGTEVEPNV